MDFSRRKLFARLLSASLYGIGSSRLIRPVYSDDAPPLSPAKSIYELSGRIAIDGQKATLNTRIRENSIIETGRNGKLIFAVGKDAFILRGDSHLEIQGDDQFIQGLKLVSGALLSVLGGRFQNQSLVMNTTTAIISLRGTGIYVESEPEQSYVCTCYGMVELSSITDPLSREMIKTTHHDLPRYVLLNAPEGKKIREAPVINHDDDELTLIESLVGRKPPFGSGGYKSTESNPDR